MARQVKKPESIADLKALAFKIPKDGIVTEYSIRQAESFVSPFGKPMVYYSNNGVILFVDEALTNYVIPFVDGFTDVLASEGYKEFAMFVPFSNGEYPKANKSTWHDIREMCKDLSWLIVRERAKSIAKKRKVGPVPKQILLRAKEIPYYGVDVKHPYYETTIEPNIHSCFITDEAAKLIGTYCTNNGTFVIQSDDGKTYTVKHFDGIYELLSNAGYTYEYQFVPFSNGEVAIS